MPVPSPRNKILPARGNLSDLQAALSDLLEGEICYAFDLDQYYQVEGGVLIPVGASKAQGILADSALQAGDNVSELNNDAGYITSGDVPAPPVTSVAGKTGAVTLQLADITDWDAADYATAAQGVLADSALQSGDDISELNNDAGYITAGDVPAAPVTSVAGKTGAVTLQLDDITDWDAADYATAAQGALADTAVQPGDLATVATSGAYSDLSGLPDLSLKADLVGGVVPTSQIPAIAITEYLGEVADQAAMLALSGEAGDWCIRTDTSSTWVITSGDGSVIGNWTELAYPAGDVTSVNGQTGTVVLAPADIGAATAAQGATADTALQSGDNVSELTNDAGYITAGDVPAAPVTSVAGKTGAVTLSNDDISGGDVDAVNGTFTGEVTASVYRTTNSNGVISEGGSNSSGSIRLSQGTSSNPEYVPLNITQFDASVPVFKLTSFGTNSKIEMGGSSANATITLNSNGGSGTFAGSVITQGNLQAQNDSGQFIQMEADPFDGGTKVFGFYDGSSYTSSISPDGSGTFLGRVNVGISTFNNRALCGYSASTTAGTISALNYDAGGLLFQGYNASVSDSVDTFHVRSDGSLVAKGTGSFSGHVGIGEAPVTDNNLRSTSDNVYNIVAKSARPGGAGTDQNFTGLDSSGNVTCAIKANGSADLTGVLTVSENINGLKAVSGAGTSTTPVLRAYSDTLSAYTADINADGSIQFGGTTSYLKHTEADGLYRVTGGTTTWNLAADGSASVAGPLKAGPADCALSFQAPDGRNALLPTAPTTLAGFRTCDLGTPALPWAQGHFSESVVVSNGPVVASRNSSADGAIIAQLDGTSTATIQSNGAATFTGKLPPPGGTQDLNFRVNIGNSITQAITVLDSTGLKASIDWDGSATFSNPITLTSDSGLPTPYTNQVRNNGDGLLLDVDPNSTGSSGTDLRVHVKGTEVWRNDASGNATATGDITAFSDIKLKENIEQIPEALAKVSTLRGVTYDRIDSGQRQTGVIAQELEAVLPEAVSTNEDGIKSVAYGNLAGLLIEAIKEQNALIAELRAEVDELKGK